MSEVSPTEIGNRRDGFSPPLGPSRPTYPEPKKPNQTTAKPTTTSATPIISATRTDGPFSPWRASWPVSTTRCVCRSNFGICLPCIDKAPILLWASRSLGVLL